MTLRLLIRYGCDDMSPRDPDECRCFCVESALVSRHLLSLKVAEEDFTAWQVNKYLRKGGLERINVVVLRFFLPKKGEFRDASRHKRTAVATETG